MFTKPCDDAKSFRGLRKRVSQAGQKDTPTWNIPSNMAALTTADKWRHGHIAQSSKSVRNNYNWQSHKYVYIATYQSDSKSNPNPNPNPTPAAKQHPRRRNEFEGGEPVQRKAPEIFLVVSLHFFTLKVQLVVLVSNFVMVSTVLSVSCWLFFYTYSGPPCPVICKSCGHVPPVPSGLSATEQLAVVNVQLNIVACPT